MVVEDAQSGYVGAIVGLEKAPGGFAIRLEDRHGKVRSFPLGPGYLIDGKPVELTRPQPQQRTPGRTASGSVAVPNARARVARPSQIWVEGKHDWELVHKIWGEDLKYEGVVVEPLGGLDVLAERLEEFAPDATHRVGVLADHLVTGTKETRIAQGIMQDPRFRGHVHIIGHPFIDIWAAVKPARVGIAAWPEVPRGEDWKNGVCRRLGWPHGSMAATGKAWQHILSKVEHISHVDPALSGRVEELIDFVTVGHS